MSTPISWIRLEQYHLGEVDFAERTRIEEAMTDCTTSRERLSQIAQDTRPLPEVPVVLPQRRWSTAWGGLALAAAALLAVLIPQGNTTKGGDLSLTLVRERDGVVAVAPEDFQDGDRFSIRLTCPEGTPTVTVQITQDGDRYTPYPEQRLTCGNQVPLPGAFVVSGTDDITVCVEVDREQICEELSGRE